jgi:hypothetical protein
MKFPADRLTVLLFSALIIALTSVSAHSATLIVTNTNDSGTGSLRDTIAAASDGDTIQFDAALNGQTITLTSATLVISKNLIVDGPGATQLTVQRSTANGTPAFGIFEIGGDDVTIAGLTIANGAEGGESGAAIVSGGGSVTIANCVVSGNSLPGILCGGHGLGRSTVSIINCTISGNSSSSSGGGIETLGPGFYGYQGAVVTIANSTISGNSATSLGGGIYNGGEMTVTNSTISANTATVDESGGGGGIYNYGKLTVINSTISGNSATLGGGVKSTDGFFLIPLALTFTNTTISGNSANEGGGIYAAGSANTSRNTIIALNTSLNGPDMSGQLTSEGFNLIGNNSGATISPGQSDQIGTPASPIDPLLGPLQNNGGPTFTQALLPGSPAIDQGESSGSTTDQRGFRRPVDLPEIANAIGGDGADIGALESAHATLANISTRLRVGTGDNAMIGGFIITGTQPKTVIVRGIGPSLPLPGALADPVIEVHGSSGELLATNDNWKDATTEQEIIGSGLPPTNDLESSLWGILNPGAYTVVVRGKNDATGLALFEVYDLDQTVDSKLANVSTRGYVGTGDNVMIGGTIITGSLPARVLFRAIGPSLSNFGVSNALGDPVLELYDGNGGLIAVNYDWRDDQEAEIIVTGLPPSNDLESAIVRDLAAGPYTAIVRGLNNNTGNAVIEVYSLN